MTTTDLPHNGPVAPDASDVVTGPVGEAHLRDRASAGPEGADLDRLPVIAVTADDRSLASSPGGSRHPADDPNWAVEQLEAIIQSLTTYATPVLREIAARAAELAAKAGEAAGPLAHKAAAVTEDMGGRLAAKGLEVTAELRSVGQASKPATALGKLSAPPAGLAPADQEPHAVEAGLPPRS